MRVLIDCSVISAGGGLQASLSVIRNALSDSSMETGLVCTKAFGRLLSPEERGQLAGLWELAADGVLGKILELRRFGRAVESEFSPDIVFTVFGPSYWRSRKTNLSGFALGKMLYPEIRLFYRDRWTRWRERLFDSIKKIMLHRNCDFLVVETQVVKQRVVEKLGFPASRVFVVENSYSPMFEDRLSELSQTPWDAEHRAFRILVPASYYPHKNLEVIPAACAALRSNGQSGFVFVLTLAEASKGWADILLLSREAGVESMVSTVGSLSSTALADEYFRADAILSTSLVESSTAVFPEAFLARRPLLASNRDFARSLCEDAAMYFDPLDEVSLAEAVIEVSRSASLRANLVNNGLRVLARNYPTATGKWLLQKKLLVELSGSSRVGTSDAEG